MACVDICSEKCRPYIAAVLFAFGVPVETSSATLLLQLVFNEKVMKKGVTVTSGLVASFTTLYLKGCTSGFKCSKTIKRM